MRGGEKGEMKRKKGFSGGVFQGMNLQARLSEAAFLSMILKYKEAKRYIDDGYETWEDFCVEEIGISHDTLNRRLKAVEVFGGETTRIMLGMNLAWRDIRMIEHILTEEQRSALKKGVLEFDGRKIPVNEQYAPEVLSAFDLIITRADAAIKGEKLAESKLKGVEKENRKELKAHQEEIERLQSLLPKDEDDREWAENFIEDINKAHEKFDDCLRVFAFHKKVFGDPVIQAKIIGIHEQMKARYDQFVRDFDSMLEDGE
jgi:hypothetical protein